MSKNNRKSAARKPSTRSAADTQAEIETFAKHFSQVLRIARTSDLFSSRFYNALAGAWCDFENDVNNNGLISETEQGIRVVLEHAATYGIGDITNAVRAASREQNND